MTFRACSSASGLLSAFAISRSCFCTSGLRAAVTASNVTSVSFRVVMSVLCSVDYDKNGQTQKGRTYTNSRLPPFGVCGQGFPLAILRLPGRPHGAGLRRSRSALAPGCHIEEPGGRGIAQGVEWLADFPPRFAGSNTLPIDPVGRAASIRVAGTPCTPTPCYHMMRFCVLLCA